MSGSQRLDWLTEAGLLHPAPESVTAAMFAEHPGFFMAADKVQVKYEMLRAHLLDGESASSAAQTHGYSRASFYVVARAFETGGMVGLIDERPGRRGPLKLSPEVLAFLTERARSVPRISGAQLAGELEAEHSVRLHRRTIERVLSGLGGAR
jgi:transposase